VGSPDRARREGDEVTPRPVGLPCQAGGVVGEAVRRWRPTGAPLSIDRETVRLVDSADVS
jgi:hypothetical protein